MPRVVYLHLLGLDLVLNAHQKVVDFLEHKVLQPIEDWAYRIGTTVNLDGLDLSEEDLA